MAATSSSKSSAPKPAAEQRQTRDRAEPQGTGHEPDPRGVHIPGAAPGQWADLGPVSLPADAPRR